MKGENNKAEHGPGPLLRVLQIGLANVILKLLFFFVGLSSYSDSKGVARVTEK